MNEKTTPELEKAKELLEISRTIKLLLEDNIPDSAVTTLQSLKDKLTENDYRGLWQTALEHINRIYKIRVLDEVRVGDILTDYQATIRNTQSSFDYQFSKEFPKK